MTTKSGNVLTNVLARILIPMLLCILCVSYFTGCSTTTHVAKKNVIDASGNKPKWVADPKMSWETDDMVFFKSKQVIRGDQRENSCFELAELDNRAALLQSIATFMRGAVDNVQMDISERSELVLGLTRSNAFKGKIYGLKNLERYVERTEVCKDRDCAERIECYSMSGITRKDFSRTVNEITNEIQPLDPRIKEAINKKAAKFFEEPTTTIEVPKVTTGTATAPTPATTQQKAPMGESKTTE